MRHFPIFIDLSGQRVVISGAGSCAEAKLRLILKTQADIAVFGHQPTAQIREWNGAGLLELHERELQPRDAENATLLYGANDDREKDLRAAGIGRRAGALVNLVDRLEDSDFITPAIVDRDPVTVAIGTEGAAPVLARKIKSEVEARLPASVGALARIARGFRRHAEALPAGRVRRDFWKKFYHRAGPDAHANGGKQAVQQCLDDMLYRSLNSEREPGRVYFVGAGPGDPDLMTHRARRLLEDADVVMHDRLVPQEIIDLARREATILEVGKSGYGSSWSQDEINRLMVNHAADGHIVVRLKSGDPGIFGRLDEEIAALDAAGIVFDIIPGVTSASAAAAAAGAALTCRGRNSNFHVMTGADVNGFAEHEWRKLAEPGLIAAVYMGIRASRFISGRLLMHGADGRRPVTVVENASRPGQNIVATTLARLPDDLQLAGITGPAILLIGISPHLPTAVAQPRLASGDG